MFLTIVNFAKKLNKGPTNFFKRQQIFKLAANYYGRKRNCYSIAIKSVHRALVYATKGRRLKKINEKESNIQINKKTLVDLAVWEPRTFKSLTQVAAMKEYLDPMAENVLPLKPPVGVITKGKL